MNLAAKKEGITKLVEKLTKSNDREDNLKKELANDRATLERIDDMVNDGDTLPNDIVYTSFTDWRDAVEKQITSGERSIQRISEQKIEVEALQYYVDNATE